MLCLWRFRTPQLRPNLSEPLAFDAHVTHDIAILGLTIETVSVFTRLWAQWLGARTKGNYLEDLNRLVGRVFPMPHLGLIIGLYSLTVRRVEGNNGGFIRPATEQLKLVEESFRPGIAIIQTGYQAPKPFALHQSALKCFCRAGIRNAGKPGGK